MADKRKFKEPDNKEIYEDYQYNAPILETIFKKNPRLFESYSFYKGSGYKDISSLMRDNAISYSKYAEIPKTIESKNEKFAEVYTKYNKKVNKIYSLALYTISSINNLFELFDKYNKHELQKLPVLYRGIVKTKDRPDETMFLKTKEPVRVPYFQSCSKSFDVALSFQTCSSYGPCCIYVLHVSPEVKYLPIYWPGKITSNQGSVTILYEYPKISEQEILLEPFVQYKLKKNYKKDISSSDVSFCDYSTTEPKFTIDVYEIDVLPPEKGSRKSFETLYKKLANETVKIEDLIELEDTSYNLK